MTGVSPVQLAQEIIGESTKFRLLPFSPIMEDKSTRRNTLSTLLPVLPPDWLAQVDPREAMREIVDLYELRPSMLLTEEEIAADAEPPPGAGGMPGMEDLAGMMPSGPGAQPMPDIPGMPQDPGDGGMPLGGAPPPGLLEAVEAMASGGKPILA